MLKKNARAVGKCQRPISRKTKHDSFKKVVTQFGIFAAENFLVIIIISSIGLHFKNFHKDFCVMFCGKPSLLLDLTFLITLLLLFICFVNSCCCECVHRKSSVINMLYSDPQGFSYKRQVEECGCPLHN